MGDGGFIVYSISFPGDIDGNLPAMWKTCVRSLGWEDPLENRTATIPVFWLGEVHGWRSLVGYSP